MKYKIEYSTAFKKALKKLNKKDIDKVFNVVEKLANGEKLDIKFKDHALKGDYLGYRDCHIKPDLVLIYKKQDDRLILTCVELGSHSELDL